MGKKGPIYKQICQEIITICKLFPDFSIAMFILEERVSIEDGKGFLANLKEFREQLEMDNHVVCDDEEVQAIMDEGLRIQTIIAKEQLYGKD